RGQIALGLGRRLGGGRRFQGPLERACLLPIQLEVPTVRRPADCARGPSSLWAATAADWPLGPHRQRPPDDRLPRHRPPPPTEPGQPGPPTEGPAVAREVVVPAHVRLRLAARQPQLDRLAHTRRDRGHSPQGLVHSLAVVEIDDQVYVTRPPLLAAQT